MLKTELVNMCVLSQRLERVLLIVDTSHVQWHSQKLRKALEVEPNLYRNFLQRKEI